MRGLRQPDLGSLFGSSQRRRAVRPAYGCYFLFLIAAMVAGTAFAFGATGENMYGIGRTLTFFSSGFLPIVIYTIYREYTVGPPTALVLAALWIVPVATTVLVITNPLHHMIWTMVETADGSRFTDVNEHFWINRVHAPFAYGLFGYSVVALMGRMPTIARAHRGKVGLLLLCTVLPFGVSVGNVLLKIGPVDFPFTSSTLVILLPLYWWASLKLHVYDFSPLAYQTMFDHVRDPIIVLDKSLRIVSANQPAQTLLESSEAELIGQHLCRTSSRLGSSGQSGSPPLRSSWRPSAAAGAAGTGRAGAGCAGATWAAAGPAAASKPSSTSSSSRARAEASRPRASWASDLSISACASPGRPECLPRRPRSSR